MWVEKQFNLGPSVSDAIESGQHTFRKMFEKHIEVTARWGIV